MIEYLFPWAIICLSLIFLFFSIRNLASPPKPYSYAVEVYLPAKGGGAHGKHYGFERIEQYLTKEEAESSLAEWKKRDPESSFRIWPYIGDEPAVYS